MEQKKINKDHKFTIAIREKTAEDYEIFEQKLEKLMNLYNVKTYSSLVKILIEAEIRRQGL